MKKRYADDVIPRESAAARESVAEQIRLARKECRLTQADLAELTGTKKSNISRLESGKYNPSLDFMVKVADGVGKTLVVRME